MGITYRIDRAAGIVLTCAGATLKERDMVEHVQRLARDPDFHPGLCELVDLRGVEELEVSAEGIRELAHIALSQEITSRKLAIVAESDAVYGISRMYEALTGEVMKTRVFRGFNEARDWLEPSRKLNLSRDPNLIEEAAAPGSTRTNGSVEP